MSAMISVTDARAFAQLLIAGADQAQAAGQSEFDLEAAAEGAENEGLSKLADAIKTAEQPSEG